MAGMIITSTPNHQRPPARLFIIVLLLSPSADSRAQQNTSVSTLSFSKRLCVRATTTWRARTVGLRGASQARRLRDPCLGPLKLHLPGILTARLDVILRSSMKKNPIAREGHEEEPKTTLPTATHAITAVRLATTSTPRRLFLRMPSIGCQRGFKLLWEPSQRKTGRSL